MTYSTKLVKGADINVELQRFIHEAAIGLQQHSEFKDKFPNWEKFPVKMFADREYLWVCYRNERPVGFLAATRYGSFFDPDVKILNQELLYATPGTRAANLLFKDFVDFGRRTANHVITMLNVHSNIKPTTLNKMGFTLLETSYRLEIKHGR